MEQQENENWKQDGDYIWLLEWFNHTTIFEDESSPLFKPPKKPQEMITQLFEAGALVEADLAASAIDVFKIREIRKFLDEAQIPPIGTKKQMIKKLIAHDETILRNKLNSRRTLTTSALGKRAIEEHYDRLGHQNIAYSQQIFDTLVDKNILKVCSLIFDDSRSWMSHKGGDGYTHNKIGQLQLVYEEIPPILVEKYGKEKLALLQAIGGIKLVYRGPEMTELYLPEDIEITPDELKIFETLIFRYDIYLSGVKFLKYHNRPGQITFPAAAPDICEHCRSQIGRIITPENIPDWPLAGCTNPLGCLPDFDRIDVRKA